MAKLLTRAEYADYRKAKGLPGFTYNTICTKIRDKKITCIDDKINPEVADIEWMANTRIESYSQEQREQVPLPDDRNANDIEENIPEFAVSKARIEAIKAIKEQLSLDEMQGELVKVGEVYNELFSVINTLKQSIMLIPQRISPQVASLTNITDIENLMEGEITSSLIELSERLSRSELIKDNTRDENT